MTQDEEFVKAFINKDNQRRYLALLSTAKGRIKFRKSLGHFNGIRDDRAEVVPASNHGPESVFQLLKGKGANNKGYFICGLAQYDALEMPLYNSLLELYDRGIGYIISCVPGNLAFYQGEYSRDQLILTA